MFQQGDFCIEPEESKEFAWQTTRKITEALKSTWSKNKIICYPKAHKIGLYLLKVMSFNVSPDLASYENSLYISEKEWQASLSCSSW